MRLEVLWGFGEENQRVCPDIDAAGYELIDETVGAGQSEVDIARCAYDYCGGITRNGDIRRKIVSSKLRIFWW
jgi:putative protein kinase ArgK-like GTPase of G3E family